MSEFFPRLRRASLMLLAFTLGCVTIERSYPDKNFFALEVGRSEEAPLLQPAVNGILEVSELRISPRYQGQGFTYRVSETGYEADFYNQFLIAPAALITEEVRKSLARSRTFAHVINSSSQLRQTHRLEGIVNALYGDFRDGGAGKAVVEIEFFLTTQSPTGSKVVMNKRYSKSIRLARRSPEALVKSWNEGLEEILGSLIADLRSASRQGESGSPTPPASRGRDKSGGEASR